MAYPKSLRNQLGLSTAVFADLIGCSRSQLTMTESGKRSLPASSLLLLVKLEEALRQNINKPVESTKPGKQVMALLRKHISKRRWQAEEAKQKVEKLAEKHEQLKYLLQLTQVYEAAPFSHKNDITTLLMTILKRKAQKKLPIQHSELVKAHLLSAGLQAEMVATDELRNI